MSTFISTRVGVLRIAAPAVAVALLASACGSSGGGKSASAITIESHSSPMGTYLTDSSGKSLYMFAKDSATKSNCSGTCLAYWPPLDTSGAVHVSGSASMAKINTITGSNGSKQVVYAGHPLYYYKNDTAAGDTKGEGSSNFGARWWLLAPSGQPITSSGSGSASSSSSGGGGGYG